MSSVHQSGQNHFAKHSETGRRQGWQRERWEDSIREWTGLMNQINDPHSRAPKKNTSQGNEMLPQETTHLIQKPCYQRGSPCQDPAGNWTHKDFLTIVKKRKLLCMVMFNIHQAWQKTSCKAQWKGEEDKADRGRGWKTTSGNGQAWSSPSPTGQWRTGKMEETGCEIICGAPTTLVVKG